MSGDKKRKKRAKSDRTKHLLRSILSIDVDLIHSVHQAEKIHRNTREWFKYMTKKGGLILLPIEIIRVGKKLIAEKSAS